MIDLASLVLDMPSPEELNRQTEARHLHNMALMASPGRFLAASLGAWLERLPAGLASVPATKIASIARSDWREHVDHPDRGTAAWARVEHACAAVPDGHMLRWDYCSCAALKAAMADSGAAEPVERRDFPALDMRAVDILVTIPADEFHVWARPWVDARMIDGFPVEFRVFVENNEILGISNYYPQRALPATLEILSWAQKCRAAAQAIVAEVLRRGEYPWMPSCEGRFKNDHVSATLDFIVTPTGNVLFLEAGPPAGAGAHPCAFIDRDIEGLALGLAPGVALR